MFVGRQRFSGIGPSVGMGQGFVIVPDELDDLVLQVRHGGEVAAAKKLTGQRPEPDFDLIQPGRVRGCEMEDDPLLGGHEEGLALGTGFDRRQWALAELGHRAAGQFVPMRVEVVEHQMNLPRLGIFSANGFDEVRKDLRRPVRREVAVDFARSDLQAGREAAGAMTDVLVFDSFDTPGLGRLMRVSTFEGLDAGFLIDRENDFPAFIEFLSPQVEIDNVQHLDLEVRIGTVQPVVPAMGLDRRLVQKPPDRAWADGGDESALNTGTSQVPRAPVGDGYAGLGRRSRGQGNDLMLLLRGKKSAVGLGEGGP